jgi:hypothetical protein
MNFLKYLQFLLNDQPLIINTYNNFPFKLDTRLTVNTDFKYSLKYKDYLFLVSLIKDIIVKNYNSDNTLDLWQVSFHFINNNNKLLISNTFIYCSSDYLYHVDTKIFNNDINLIIDDNTTPFGLLKGKDILILLICPLILINIKILSFHIKIKKIIINF